MNVKKAAIVGAGLVGSSIGFTIMNKGLYSELVLIDTNQERAKGEAMDLSHGDMFANPMKIYQGDYSDIDDASIVIITAGANQKPNETRLDLVKKNANIMKSIIREIKKTKFEGILLIVSNPVDILTEVALKESGFPENRVIGSGTVLDTTRFKGEISNDLGVDDRNVHAYVIGEHGDSEIAVWSSAGIASIPIKDFREMRGKFDHDKDMRRISQAVIDSAYAMIVSKGATYYGVAMSVSRILESIVSNENSILPVSVHLNGEYGISDVSLSTPSIISKNGVEKKLEIPLNDEEREKLEKSAKSLKEILKEVDL